MVGLPQRARKGLSGPMRTLPPGQATNGERHRLPAPGKRMLPIRPVHNRPRLVGIRHDRMETFRRHRLEETKRFRRPAVDMHHRLIRRVNGAYAAGSSPPVGTNLRWFFHRLRPGISRRDNLPSPRVILRRRVPHRRLIVRTRGRTQAEILRSFQQLMQDPLQRMRPCRKDHTRRVFIHPQTGHQTL